MNAILLGLVEAALAAVKKGVLPPLRALAQHDDPDRGRRRRRRRRRPPRD